MTPPPARRSQTGPLLLALVWMTAFGALQIWVLFARPLGVPSNPPRGQTLALPRDPGDAHVTQTFSVDVDGLNEVQIYPGSTARGSGGARVDVTVTDVTRPSHPMVVSRTTIEAAHLIAPGPHVIRFQPVDDSNGRLFELALDIHDPARSGGLTFLVVPDNVYPAGRLQVNGRQEWGDLAFKARATRDTPFRQLAVRAAAAGWPASPAPWLVLVVIYNVACAVWLWTIMASPRPVPVSRAVES